MPNRPAAIAAILSLPAAILFRFPPERYPFYPLCPIHQYTGLLCPGCGATRALAALLHGDLPQALHQNALLVLLLPCCLGYVLFAFRRPWPPVPPTVIAAILFLAALFTLARNLA